MVNSSKWASGWRFWLLMFIAFLAWKAIFTTDVAHRFFQGLRGEVPAASSAPARENYATCLLAGMPAAINAPMVAAVYRQCIGRYPVGFTGVRRGSGRGGSGPATPDECILKWASTTPDPRAASMIAIACACLYGPAGADDTAFCATP